ncbi:MAG TPA: bifunctional diaminohydroxyphosphoribosylaminopyrimidine deaminase/5-amino-6-(5-phosphoribosylamino)uracil reductase RibD [Bacteroidia bacterium]|nr:bifunctional diaminohydroxyphosphoribosylaminopyrimidine deaminase/5-amino-6-(5-phosphoribosylamino)uracil reductase RibD [Bacteroidia bacterium]
MHSQEYFMQRCLDLARRGAGKVAPNPMVGCVIVCDGIIIGEGWHEQFGGPHAEVNAIRSVNDQRLLQQSTLYVSLEPCNHHGKTPPCTELIIEKQIPYVVVACLDINPQVKGKGIQNLIMNGIDVKVGVLEKEAQELNKRFFTSVSKHRPYIILKWAQSEDGFIDHDRDEKDERAIISSPESHLLVHQWRSDEAAILVGTNTVICDDPQLTVRLIDGRNPVRMTFDRLKRIPSAAKILDGTAPTIIFTEGAHYYTDRAEYIAIDFSNNPLAQVMHILHERKLESVLVEGGAALINKFLEQNLWDEARVFVATKKIGSGVKAPVIKTDFTAEEKVGIDKLYTYYKK